MAFINNLRFQSVSHWPSKLPVHSISAPKTSLNATKPTPLSVTNNNIRRGNNNGPNKDKKTSNQQPPLKNPTSMKRKLSSSPKDDTRVARVKLNNSTARATVGPPKRALSSTQNNKIQPSNTNTATKPSRAISKPVSVTNRRSVSTTNTKKPSIEKDATENKPAIANNTNGLPKLKKRPAWDTKGRLTDMEQLLPMLQSKVKSSDETVNSMKDLLEQEHITELEAFRQNLQLKVENKETENQEAMRQVSTLKDELLMTERKHNVELENLRSRHKRELDDLDTSNQSLQRQKRSLEQELEDTMNRLSDQKTENSKLRTTISENSAAVLTMESNTRNLKLKLENTEATLKEREKTIEQLTAELHAAKITVSEIEDKLLEEEKNRRFLHNTIQELKGNIRVFCRIRPVLESEATSAVGVANIAYPGKDKNQIELTDSSTTSSGTTATKAYPFTFDRVFQPNATQNECFEEISQLVQSALDGYNVCIFAYGQTGSGKTYTMEGIRGASEEESGMIPRTVRQIYRSAEKLKEKNWTYEMEGQFLQIYNETIHDLLGNASDFGKMKHEIKHEKNGNTTVTDMTTVVLDSPSKVANLLKKASQNRAVGATNINERSSRSHSVFTLRLKGKNTVTGEVSTGVLNLIDLAGSERLSASGSTGDRLKETQAINKSLSSLGDVIYALATSKEGSHIPYRNSKLTYLLQHSLGGNSKTLMFVNISPLVAHFGETLCSLRFATKVNSCQIGTAKKNIK
ncbi:kinesin-like nuclear fusion protein [Umbelopsis sp. WA50703]